MNRQGPIAFLLQDIQDAEHIEILDSDEWSDLFLVTFTDGRQQRGVYFRPTLDIEANWELEDEGVKA